jgi:hypothetical protein
MSAAVAKFFAKKTLPKYTSLMWELIEKEALACARRGMDS